MSDTISLRDHTEPCEHGSLWSHFLNVAKSKWWHEPDCVGGRELIFQLQADGVWKEVPPVARR